MLLSDLVEYKKNGERQDGCDVWFGPNESVVKASLYILSVCACACVCVCNVPSLCTIGRYIFREVSGLLFQICILLLCTAHYFLPSLLVKKKNEMKDVDAIRKAASISFHRIV